MYLKLPFFPTAVKSRGKETITPCRLKTQNTSRTLPDCSSGPKRSSILYFFKDLKFAPEYYKDFTLQSSMQYRLKTG